MWSSLFKFALLSTVLAAPAADSDALERRLITGTLNDGNAFVQGTIDGMTWQASGVLEEGCTLSTINDCYHMFLISNTTEELDTNHLSSPRQRDEFHFPQVDAGVEFSYTWKQYLYSSTGTGTTWFHLFQAFGVEEDSPLITLDAEKDELMIKDYVRGTGGPQCGDVTCPVTDLSNYHGTTTTHTASGSFGPDGSLSYKVVNSATGDEIISYSVSGDMGAGAGYVKFGIYRLCWDGMTNANAVVGDWAS
uniref:DOMON domain-containing protein n=1 Tax=Mycena chlorophos TaxID=658473 RepID=A0ABQ0LUR5_MYCCL|nr:predicted protein [Mycena chlorophos]